MVARSLLEDGSLGFRADAETWPAVEPWVPRIPPREPAPGEVRAWIDVRAGEPAFAAPAEPPALELRTVEGWVRPSGEILLLGPAGRVSATVAPAARRADVRLRDPAAAPETLGVEIMAALTLASAFLLGRLARTLVHAGAIVAPGGTAWLLAGGTFSGKTTTCVNLIRAGWDWLADDHVILARGVGGIEVEGWPRRFNLDHGYSSGSSLGVRSRVEPEGLGPGRWRRSAPLGGLLFPRVEAGSATALEPLHPAGALSRLLQQSPWLLADPGAAPAVLALLQDAARAPAFQLRLGRDSLGDATRLQDLLAAAAESAGGGGTHNVLSNVSGPS